MACFPLMIEVKGKTGLVIGGGKVALHKIKVLLPFGIRLYVVSEQFCDELLEIAEENREQLLLFERKFCKEDIICSDVELCFVIAATDDAKLQNYVSDICSEKKIPVNVVDVKEKSSFYFPAIAKQSELVVAVSTGGNSPVAAGYIKEHISKNLPDYYGKLVDLLGKYRDTAFEKIEHYDDRKSFFRELLIYGEEHGGDIPEEIVWDRLAKYI